MRAPWWQYRQWKFVADMNGDGAFSASDISHWVLWLFFMPGDAVIAWIGPAWFARLLNLTSVGFGSATSGWISAALWVFGIWVVYFFLDCGDPTYRQRQREAREAARREHLRRAHLVGRKQRRFPWRFRPTN
jgi:hypothetical protein